MSDTELDWVTLTDLCFDALVGILPSEQTRAQPVELQIRMGLSLEECARTGDLTRSVNYAEVAHQVRFITQQGRWRLIESLGTAICRAVLAEPVPAEGRASVQRVEISIRKPTILDGLATPGVEMARNAEWCVLPAGDGVVVQTLEVTSLSGAWRVLLPEGHSWTAPAGSAVRVVAGRVLADSELGPGAELGRTSGSVEALVDSVLLVVGTP